MTPSAFLSCPGGEETDSEASAKPLVNFFDDEDRGFYPETVPRRCTDCCWIPTYLAALGLFVFVSIYSTKHHMLSESLWVPRDYNFHACGAGENEGKEWLNKVGLRSYLKIESKDMKRLEGHVSICSIWIVCSQVYILFPQASKHLVPKKVFPDLSKLSRSEVPVLLYWHLFRKDLPYGWEADQHSLSSLRQRMSHHMGFWNPVLRWEQYIWFTSHLQNTPIQWSVWTYCRNCRKFDLQRIFFVLLFASSFLFCYNLGSACLAAFGWHSCLHPCGGRPLRHVCGPLCERDHLDWPY